MHRSVVRYARWLAGEEEEKLLQAENIIVQWCKWQRHLAFAPDEPWWRSSMWSRSSTSTSIGPGRAVVEELNP